MSNILDEKLQQAHAILDELNVDAWMMFVRESAHGGDPVLELVHDGSFTWQTALIVTRGSDRIAIVGQLDDGPVRAAGIWSDVIPYVHSIRDPLVEVLEKLDPRSLALDYSTDDYSADGLSFGMYLLLNDYLKGTPYAERFVSAQDIVAALRGRKSATELQRMHTAIEITQNIFHQVGQCARVGMTEREVATFMLDAASQAGVEPAWEQPCPIVNTGPESMAGHGVPSDLKLEPGHVLHIDFGVRYDGYCSDLQRCWYVPRDGEDGVPAPVGKAFDAVVGGITVASEVLKPGVEGRAVDAAARSSMVQAGYPEYQHALGHHVGRAAHDGGGILGPEWPRYGRTPFRKVECDNVFTLEPSVQDAGGAGCIGLEEMVLVTDDGYRWLSTRQTVLPLLRNS